jgi:moderate conductance mechanosensitive channel
MNAGEGMAGMAMTLLDAAKGRISALGADLAQAPGEFHATLAAASGALMTGSGVRAATYLVILLLVGAGVEWLYWTYAYGPLRALEATRVASPRHAFRLALRRLALHGAGLVLFALATLAASAAFTWPRGMHEAVVALTLFVLFVRLAWIGVSVILAPGRPAWRLVPVAPQKAGWLAATIMGVAVSLALARFVPDLAGGAAPHVAATLRLAFALLAAALLLVAAFAFIGRPAQPGAAGPKRRLPQFPASIVAAAMVVGVFGLWLLRSGTAASVAGIVCGVILAQMALRDLVFFYWQDMIDAGVAEAADPPAIDSSDPALLPSIALSTARFMVVLLGLAACALELNAPLAGMGAGGGPLARLGFDLLGVAALALFTHLVWIVIRTTIDHRLKRIGPYDPHGEANPNARLLTLLPLLRTSSAVLLVVILILSSLWALGIEITPLLAGAGVVGLAVGFGAQALVRDVIAGIFFLAEDVFRVGEYIESGSTTKGTVERITLRTVALRHHNGPLYFVPYGSLGSVRNNSRDWVIEKFNIPLPIGVDSEQVRKMIKKIGIEMLEDPDVGHMMRMPLKSKLARVDPGVKVFRCKFQTAPGNQFDVRAQAFKRIEAALRAQGISFAGGAQTVIMERHAAGATPA